MNERIRELAEQANKQIRHRICPNTFKPIDDPNGPHIRIEFDKEKFAELIVKECVSKCNTIEDKALQHREYKMQSTATLIKILIEEHFGVKE